MIKLEKCLWKDNLDLLDEDYEDEKKQKEDCKKCNGYNASCEDYMILPC